MSRMIATWFGVGLLPGAPGTWGSAVAVVLAIALHYAGGFPLLALATVAVTLIGWWATHEATKGAEDHDPSEIVVDEVAGQWVALCAVSYGAWHAGVDALALWPGWLAGFVLFRVFDITKFWIVGWADRRDDALGVMLDDVIAGVFAAIGVMALAGLWHGVLGL
ncbi:phosphatidylglycerophosphatase A [Salinihabitans flavidus]|uniref:Phosphatidylglycerophosphatase A n=1 Tax=Salinihabitans flavidus TaxID=569882 RepID=A0A1H8NJJ5_9RHOB|nr:phosphatidylglycerophosphatase A [Salinihabitans flavidus]SEO29774.1 phosphatidylglycerophosphatase A [Salinihabitans flavidus]